MHICSFYRYKIFARCCWAHSLSINHALVCMCWDDFILHKNPFQNLCSVRWFWILMFAFWASSTCNICSVTSHILFSAILAHHFNSHVGCLIIFQFIRWAMEVPPQLLLCSYWILLIVQMSSLLESFFEDTSSDDDEFEMIQALFVDTMSNKRPKHGGSLRRRALVCRKKVSHAKLTEDQLQLPTRRDRPV